MKILYLVNKKYFLTKMSRVRFHGMQALEKLPSVDLKWWGMGWEGYDNNLTVSQNIDQHQIEYDFIVVYKPLEMKDFKSVPGKKVIRYNEMYNIKWTCEEIEKSGCQYVICHHENDYHQYKEMYATRNPNIHFYHIAHCAEQTIFYPGILPFKDRKYDIVVSGAQSQHYPMRNKFLKMLKTLQIEQKYNIYYHPHPGYDLKDAHTNKYMKQLAEVYRNAKICLTCSGKPKSRFGKYVEIPACGAVVCGDLPDEDQDSFKEFMIVTSCEESERSIIAKLEHVLHDPLEWQTLSEKGYEWSQNYTQEKYASRMYLTFAVILNEKPN